MNYRRVFIPGGTYFFTVVTHLRKPIFSSPESIDLLRDAFRYTLKRHPFTIVACVILPDHLHFIWTLPRNSSDFSTRWRLIKSYFSRHWTDQEYIIRSKSRVAKQEKEIWQRRFWEHLIRDEADLNRHIDYIHFNPVKHGFVDSPFDWKYSSFPNYVRQGKYQESWGETAEVSAGNEWGNEWME